MTPVARALAFLVLTLLAACSPPPPDQPDPAPLPSAPQARKITTEEQAIAAVHADIRDQGRDPARVECSAMELEDSWNVTAWRIMYPENAGSSRFVPGGFTTYIVGHNGDILKRVPGH